MLARERLRAVVSASALLLAGHTIAAQVADSTRRLPPRVIGVFDGQTGSPLAGVQVLDAFSGSYVLTSSSGAARLDFVTFRGIAGFVELRKLGYQPKSVLINKGDTIPITELLEPVAQLAPVVTTEKFRIDRDAGLRDGFETRCQSKSAYCIRPDEIEKHATASLADLLVRADGFTIGSCGGGSGRYMANRNAQCGKIAMRPTTIPPAFCQPPVFIDGFEWDAHPGSAIDLVPGQPAQAPFTPVNVKSIEVYPPGKPRPLRFSGDPSCGVVVIWTK
jgi:hypothetical protein